VAFLIKNMGDAFDTDDQEKFYSQMITFILITFLSIPQRMFNMYTWWACRIYWRKFLSDRLMSRYFAHQAFYRLLNQPEVDNPGMRIVDDVEQFTFEAIHFFNEQTGYGLQMVAGGIMIYMMAPILVPIVIPYALLCTLLTIGFFGKKMIKATRGFFAHSAFFRTGFVQVAEYAESIAFLDATGHEQHWAVLRLKSTLNDMWEMARQDINQDAILKIFDRFADAMHLIILAPIMWSKDADDASAFKLKAGSLGLAGKGTHDIMKGAWMIVKEFPRIANMTASAKRIQELMDTFDELDRQWFRRLSTTKCPLQSLKEAGDLPSTAPSMVDGEGGSPCQHPDVIIRACSLETPDGTPLVQDLNLVVCKGTSVVIMGPSGVGKSSLLRAIAGLWEPKDGCITLPGNNTPMFLPQNVYIPDIPLKDNSLRAQLLFPREAQQHSEKVMESVVRKCVNLGHLMAPDQGVYTTGNWRKMLSGGEKQRLAMARLLLAKPQVAFLDEATSALDPENEARLYKALQHRNATYISVGHKVELRKYHTHILELLPKGEWKFYESKEFEEPDHDYVEASMSTWARSSSVPRP